MTARDREPRLAEVAERAGVSLTTVSRVLNNRGYLSAATRSRVMAAIDEVGYQPNEVARSLLTRRTGTVGLILPSVATPFYGEVAVHVLEVHDGGQASAQLNRLFLVRRLLRAQRQVHERTVRQQRGEADGDAGSEEAPVSAAEAHPLQSCPYVLHAVSPFLPHTRCRC